MTRPLEEIAADLLAVRREHQEAVAAHQEAKATFATLKARAKVGDGTVTAKALAEAEDAAWFTQLPVDAKFEAIKPLEAEFYEAETDTWADDFSPARARSKAAVGQILAEIQAALERLVPAWRYDADLVDQAYLAVGSTVRESPVKEPTDIAGVMPRRVFRRGPHVLVDNVVLSRTPVIDPLERMFREAHARLRSGQPKAER